MNNEIPSLPKSIIPVTERLRLKIYNRERIELPEFNRLQVDWILFRDQDTVRRMVTELGNRWTTGDETARHQWNDCQRALRALGVTFNETDPTKIESFGTEEQVVLARERTNPFPKETPLPVDRIWTKISIEQAAVGPPENRQIEDFLVLDLNTKDARQIIPMKDASESTIQNTQAIENFLSVYDNFRGHHVQDTSLKVVIPLKENRYVKESNDETDLLKMILLQKPDTRNNPKIYQKLYGDGITREELEKLSTGTKNAVDTLNEIFDIKDRVGKAKNIFWRFHGWTGKAEAICQPQFFDDLDAHGENSIGIIPTLLGNGHSLSPTLFGIEDSSQTDEIKVGAEIGITPRISADHVFTVLDRVGFWDRRLTLDGHSHSGAMVIELNHLIHQRADDHNSGDVPKYLVVAEVPALHGTNTFQEVPWSVAFLSAGDLAHVTKLSIHAPLITRTTTRFYARQVVPQQHSQPVIEIHSEVAADPRDAEAVRLQSLGLKSQRILPSEVIASANDGRSQLIFVRAEADRLTSAYEQARRETEYGFEGMDILLRKGDELEKTTSDFSDHFPHLSPVFTAIFSQIWHDWTTLPYGQFVEQIGAFREVLPISNLTATMGRRDWRLDEYGKPWLLGGPKIDPNSPGWEDEIENLLVPRWRAVWQKYNAENVKPEVDLDTYLNRLRQWALLIFPRGAFPAINEDDLAQLHHKKFAPEAKVVINKRNRFVRVGQSDPTVGIGAVDKLINRVSAV